jgi:PBSX family phage portal protein
MRTALENMKVVELGNGDKLVDAKLFLFQYQKANEGYSQITYPFDNMPGGLEAIRPTYAASVLQHMREYMGILGPCIRCMARNIDSLGYELVYRLPADALSETELNEAAREKNILKSLFDNVNAHGQGMAALRQGLRIDYETTGRWAMEVIRNMKGDIVELYRIPQANFYMTKADNNNTQFTMIVRDPSSGALIPTTRYKRFRRYFQQVSGTKIFFKEWGDPRPISYLTGQPTDNKDELANECIFHALLWSDDNPYGEPRWIGNLIRIAGFWKSEQTNYFYLNNRGIPEFIVAVSGGSLTQDSLEIIKNRFQETKGPENMGKSVVLNSLPGEAGDLVGEKQIAPKIEVVPLADKTLTDSLFQNYQKNAETAVRRDFGLSPIILGMSEDHTQATAKAALIMAEEQVFEPERKAMDEIINSTILPALEINFLLYKSLGNNTTDQTTIARALSPFMNAMPMSAIWRIVGDTMNIEMPDLDESIKNMPYFQALRQFVLPEEQNIEGESDEEKLVQILRAVTSEKRRRLNAT